MGASIHAERASRKMGLGSLSLVTLAEAREAAQAARRLLFAGVDPIEARRAAKGAARDEIARQLTFKRCADKFIAAHRAGWRSARHASQ
jgi:hypothetical protein